MRRQEKRLDKLEQGTIPHGIICINSDHGDRDRALREYGYDPDDIAGAFIFHTIYEQPSQWAQESNEAIQTGAEDR